MDEKWVLSDEVWNNEAFRKGTPIFALVVTEPNGNVVNYGYADYYDRERECDTMLQMLEKGTAIRKKLYVISESEWKKLDQEKESEGIEGP